MIYQYFYLLAWSLGVLSTGYVALLLTGVLLNQLEEADIRLSAVIAVACWCYVITYTRYLDYFHTIYE